MRRLTRNANVVGLVLCLTVSIVSAIDATTRTDEIGGTPPSLYVFFVGFVGTLVFVRTLKRNNVQSGERKGAMQRVSRSLLMGLGIAGIAYMSCFLVAMLIAGSPGARIVAENVVWFVVGGILMVGAIEMTTHIRGLKG